MRSLPLTGLFCLVASAGGVLATTAWVERDRAEGIVRPRADELLEEARLRRAELERIREAVERLRVLSERDAAPPTAPELYAKLEDMRDREARLEEVVRISRRAMERFRASPFVGWRKGDMIALLGGPGVVSANPGAVESWYYPSPDAEVGLWIDWSAGSDRVRATRVEDRSGSLRGGR